MKLVFSNWSPAFQQQVDPISSLLPPQLCGSEDVHIEQQVKHVLPRGMLLEANSLLGITKRWKEPADPHSQGSRRPCYLCCLSRGCYMPAMERNGNPEAAHVSDILRKQQPAGGRRLERAECNKCTERSQKSTSLFANVLQKDLAAFQKGFLAFFSGGRGKTESKANTGWTFTDTR